MIFFAVFGYLADLCLYLSVVFYILFSNDLQTSPLAIAFCAVPKIVYTIMIIRRKRWILSSDAIRSRLRLLLGVLPVLLFLSMISNSGHILQTFSFPFYFVTLFTLIMLLRLSRHKDPSLLPKKYFLLNALSLVGLSLVAMALSSHVFLNALLSVLTFLYLRIFGPAFIWLAYGIVYVFVTVWNLIASLFHLDRTLEVPDNPVNNMQNNEVPPSGAEVAGAPAWVNIIFIALGVLLFAALVYYVARRLAMGRDTGFSGEGTLADSSSLPPAAKKPAASESRSRSPRGRVRHYYRKLLRLCQKKELLPAGSTLPKGLTSEKAGALAKTLTDSAAIPRLRTIYLPARYSPKAQISTDMAEEAQGLWKEIKKDVQG